MMKKIKAFFKSKKIIHSWERQPGELRKVFMHKGKKYVRIAFTNRVKHKGMEPITDILMSSVTHISAQPSAFKKWRYRLMGLKAKAKIYKIKNEHQTIYQRPAQIRKS
jgi:hypothetical protein